MFRWVIPTIIAVVAGLLVLLGYLAPIPIFVSVRIVLVRWATVLAAFALVLAYGSILKVHIARVFRRRIRHRIASLILLVSAVITLVLVLLQGPEGIWVQAILSDILIPGQSAVLALTAVTLLLSGMRLFTTRRSPMAVLFLATALLMLLGTIPVVYPRTVELIVQLVDAAATGGMRGLLLGVSLGIVITGLRIILGIDRPYSGG